MLAIRALPCGRLVEVLSAPIEAPTRVSLVIMLLVAKFTEFVEFVP